MLYSKVLFLLMITAAHFFKTKMLMYSTKLYSDGQSRFTAVPVENNTIINNTRINSCVSRTHNCKPTFAHPSIYISLFSFKFSLKFTL